MTFHSDPADVTSTLVAKLRALRIQVEREEPANGEVVARCLTLSTNMILWRCWSDKLLFKVTPSGGNTTRLDVYAIPNLFRIRARKDEIVIDVRELMSQLFV